MNKVFSKIMLILFFCANIHLYAQDNDILYTVNGKLVTYYMLSRDSVTSVKVNGPGKLTITTRAHFTTGSPDSLSYTVVYQIDKSKIKIFTAKKVFREGNKVDIQSSDDVPSTSKTFSINVEPDEHIYEFLMLKSSPQVDLHYRYVPDSVPDWGDINTTTDTAKIYLKVGKENIQDYYRVSYNVPQQFKVTGPTSLRILTRLEYDYTMQGQVSYRIQVKRNDTILNTYKLYATPSTESQYLFDKKHVPGTLEKFYLDVPAGENNYEFSILDKQFSSLIRISKQKNK